MNNKGVSIYFALIILTILLAIGLGLSTLLVNEIRMIKEIEDSVIAFYAADTGVERIIYECREMGCEFFCSVDCLGSEDFTIPIGIIEIEGPTDIATYSATWTTDEGINSYGMYNNTTRAIEVIY